MADLDRFFALLRAVPVPDDAEALYDAATPAGALRLGNLERYLTLLAVQGPTTVLVAEAPGWRGATVTGIPFASIRELTARPGLVTGDPCGDGFTVPGSPPATWEASAAFVWRALAAWPRPLPIAWPVYPHHPFRPGDRRTNRTPRPAEVRAGAPVALELIRALGVRHVVAIGRKAQGALALAGIEAHPVRHPAQGGATEFAAGMAALAAARAHSSD
jgi:hypothetical protein